MKPSPRRSPNRLVMGMLVGLMAAMVGGFIVLLSTSRGLHARPTASAARGDLRYGPKATMDTSGFTAVVESLPQWRGDATLREISDLWRDTGWRQIAKIDDDLAKPEVPQTDRIMLFITKALLLNYENEPNRCLRGGAGGAFGGRER